MNYRTAIPQAIQRDVAARSMGNCQYPGCQSKAQQIHHINGNPTDHRLDNLVHLCDGHHGSQDGQDPELQALWGKVISIDPNAVKSTSATATINLYSELLNRPQKLKEQELANREAELRLRERTLSLEEAEQEAKYQRLNGQSILGRETEIELRKKEIEVRLQEAQLEW